MAPLEPQEKGFALADWHLKSCAACGIRYLLGVVSKRLGLLLSSLSLCLRFGSLTQFPPTLDLYRFAIACRGGFAGARRSTHYQDDMHCQMIRLHQNKMSRAAAPRAGKCNRQASHLFELLACNENFLWEGVREGYLFFKKRYPSLIIAPLRGAGNKCSAVALPYYFFTLRSAASLRASSATRR